MKIFSLKAIRPLAFVAMASAAMPSLAQDSTLATKTTTSETVSQPMTSTHLKTFGGAKQYSKWSFGIGAGGLNPSIALGGLNQFSNNKIEFGYDAFIKWQMQHSFGISINYLGGTFTANNEASSQNANYTEGISNGGQDVSSKLTYAVSIKGEVDVATIDFLRRQSAVRVFVTGGYGIAGFKPDLYNGSSITAGFVPIGAGLKIKVSRAVAVNLGYEVIFFDAPNLLGTAKQNNFGDARLSKGSYAHAGLEFTFGTGHKPAMIWTNPIAVMYDELKANDSLAKEVDGLKTRVGAVEGDISNLKKDSDGDGVSDVFDKCANTPAGTKVDGSGCELPKVQLAPDTTAMKAEAPKDRVQFAFDSDVITTDSYPTLDNLAKNIRDNKERLTLSGHASAEGTEDYNFALSRKRANTVKKYLVAAGAPSRFIKTIGYGETRPIASNDTEEGRQKNRRVEFRTK